MQEDNERILRKIKRCLALAKSSNANEAATALRQAQALMNQHGITMAGVAASEVSSHETPSGSGLKPPVYIQALLAIIMRAFGVKVIHHAETTKRGRWVGQVEFYGIANAPEIAAYAYDVLLRQLKRDRAAFVASLPKQLNRSTKTIQADLYAHAWATSVSEKISTQTISDEEQRSIQAYEKKSGVEDLDYVKTTDRTPEHMDAADISAVMTGLYDGKKIDFYQGVGGTSGGLTQIDG